MKVCKPITDWRDVPLVLDLPLAARIVGQSPEYLKKRAQRGDFPAYKEGNQWRVGKTALMAHIGEPHNENLLKPAIRERAKEWMQK